MPWNPERYMKTEDVVKILEDNKITNVGKDRPYTVSSDMIVIGADHRGYNLKKYVKKYLLENHSKIIDVGVYNEEAMDYPLVAKDLCTKLLDSDIETTRGILICGSGFGMCISANRHGGIHAVTARTIDEVEIARQHGNINVLCLGADFTTNKESEFLMDIFLNTSFEGGRHARRIGMIG